jgi:hypothetical protein
MIGSRFVWKCTGIVTTLSVFNVCGLSAEGKRDMLDPEKEEAVLSMMEQHRPSPESVLPDGVPIYPGMRGTCAVQISGDYLEGKVESAVTVTGSSRDSREKVLEFYRTELGKNGYKAGPVETDEKEEAITQTFSKDRLTVLVGVVRSTHMPSYPTTVILDVSTAQAGTGSGEKGNNG